MQKLYVIDTNVIIHDPLSINKLSNGNEIVIPYTVLEELDRNKTKQGEVGANVRKGIRLLEERLIEESIFVEEVDYSIESPDDRILGVASRLSITRPDSKVILVTKDVCLRTKARASGVLVEDYRDDKVDSSDLYTGFFKEIIKVPEYVISMLYENGSMPAEMAFNENECVIFEEDGNSKNRAITIFSNGVLNLIDNSITASDLPYVNLEQRVLLNHIFNDNIDLVTITGQAGCYPKGTEFFTGTKWKPIEDYTEGDLVMQVDPTSLQGSLVTPDEYIKKSVDRFYKIKNRRVEFTTSEHHKHLVYNIKTKRHETLTTDKLYNTHNSTKSGNNKKLITSFFYEGPGIPLSDDQIRLRIAIIADGYINPENNHVQASFKKDRKIDRFRHLLEKVGVSYKEGVVSGYTRFWFVTDVYEKEFEDYWYNSSKSQLAVIADEVLKWDGSITHRDNRKSRGAFFTTSEKSRDFIQYVFTVLGKNPTVYNDVREGRKTCYTVLQNNSKGIGITKNHRSKTTTEITPVESEDGLMYCFSVPSGFFAVRQNNQIFVSGNSGKTLMAIAAGLDLLSTGKYKKMTIARPIMPFQKDIGYLPGDVDEKLLPWFAPIVDNLNYLVNFDDQTSEKRAGYKSAFEELVDQGVIEMCPLTYIRGRSIPDQVIIVDEAQQVTTGEIKTILTRAGNNTKVILTGDYSQIDNPYLTADTNGLVYCVDKFKDEELAAHVTLVECKRSRLADVSSKLL